MKKDSLVVLAGVVNLGCIVGLAAIGLKRNKDCYNAECKLLHEQLDNISKAVKIESLETEIKKLKGEA